MTVLLFGGVGGCHCLVATQPAAVPWQGMRVSYQNRLWAAAMKVKYQFVLIWVLAPLLKRGLVCANSCGDCKWRETLD